MYFIGRHEKKHKGNNRNTHIHFNFMYILFIDDWLLCIVIPSVVQWSALCLTHWSSWLNFCGKHIIFNLKRNAIMSIVLSYITSDIIKFKISVGSGESCELTPWRPGLKSCWCLLLEDLFLFHANYKVKYNHCVEIIRCLDGALISSDVNALNSSGSDPRENVDRGTAVAFYWSTWKNMR